MSSIRGGTYARFDKATTTNAKNVPQHDTIPSTPTTAPRRRYCAARLSRPVSSHPAPLSASAQSNDTAAANTIITSTRTRPFLLSIEKNTSRGLLAHALMNSPRAQCRCA